MERIFLFIYRYRAFFSFLFLEVFCAWLIVQNNQYQGARFFNSSNSFVGNINSLSHGIGEYFSLSDVNQTLAKENAELRTLLEQQNQKLVSTETTITSDSGLIRRFDFVSAKVVNNSVDRFKNFVTINKGNDSGLEPGMAVISSQGVVGKIKMTSEHFSVVTSLLHVDIMVSGYMKRTGYFGTIQWTGLNPDYVDFDYIPRHVKPVQGDTIVTSGYSGIFPDGILIGTIAEVDLSDEAPFYKLKVKLAQDFNRLSFVAVIRSNLKHELDSLEQQIPDMKR